MTRAQLLLGAFTIDWLLGDPETLPHPVRWMGKGIARGELALRRRGQSDLEEFLAGMFFTASIVLTS
jgi:adenosylcobinamide-phosphate synthase